MAKYNFFKNKKCLAKYLSKFLISSVFHKKVIFLELWVIITHVLIKHVFTDSSGLQKNTFPPSPSAIQQLEQYLDLRTKGRSMRQSVVYDK
jgi:hypothetical protein